MGSFLIGLLIVIGVLAALAVIATIGTYVALGRHNRVVSDVRSPTPVTWLASPRPEALLHRRLRAAGRRLELVRAPEGLADVITRLRVELIDLDTYLVTVARRPRRSSRRADRHEVAERVTAIEGLVRRVEDRSQSQAVSLDEITERLDLLEAADKELRDLDPG